MKRILLPPFVVSIASNQVVTQGGHSCFLLSPASDVPVLPALQEQHLELEFLTVKDEAGRIDGSL